MAELVNDVTLGLLFVAVVVVVVAGVVVVAVDVVLRSKLEGELFKLLFKLFDVALLLAVV